MFRDLRFAHCSASDWKLRARLRSKCRLKTSSCRFTANPSLPLNVGDVDDVNIERQKGSVPAAHRLDITVSEASGAMETGWVRTWNLYSVGLENESLLWP